MPRGNVSPLCRALPVVGYACNVLRSTDIPRLLQADVFMDAAMDGAPKRHQRETRVDFDKVLKMASHADVVELYLFVLQRYKTLDGQSLHAVTSFLTRVCDKLNLEPMLYQVWLCFHPQHPPAASAPYLHNMMYKITYTPFITVS